MVRRVLWYHSSDYSPTATRPCVSPIDLGLGDLFAHMADAVFVADVASERIVLWNAAAETPLFGYPSEVKRWP